ncbi:MAG: SRPBCC domain-containing protein, partial [Acidobacteriota bacterium]
MPLLPCLHDLRRTFLCASLPVLLLAATPAAAEESPPDLLHERLAVFEPYLGTWELDTTWSSGASVWSKAEYRPAVGGQFVEVKTWVSDGGGPAYLRYHSFLGMDADGGVIARNFNHDGTTQSVDYEMPEAGVLVTEWSMGQGSIRERYAPSDDGTARWQVWMRPAAAGADAEWQQIMDGKWRRVALPSPVPDPETSMTTRTDSPIRPIDPALFVASGAELRSFAVEELIDAPVERVFGTFADGATLKAGYGPQFGAFKAHIDLAVGGRYEWLFDGAVGSNGCQVLSYVPDRMISFSWNAPPDHGENRDQHTWVVVEFEPRDGGTAVRLTHLGFGEGTQWDETLAYFENAWVSVLTLLKTN